ncbi:MAG: alpha-N-arabinofuranosidase [Candidatus Acidiferrales bacterium]
MMDIERRTFLALLAAAPLCFAEPEPAKLTILLDEPLGTINPRIYGQFTEHIGQVIYGGIWVGENSKVPNVKGYRTDTLKALNRVRASVVRWPGGCFADAYHWEDGVGPRKDRPNRRNTWWLRDEPNSFGTDEFLEWCQLLKAEPFLTVNVGTSSPAEAINWLEYCNVAGDTTYAQMRVRNGHAQPYGVRLWGIGNENWGCGGLFSPAEYAHAFREYAVYFKRMGLSSDTELVGVGSIEEGWNSKFLDAAGPGLPYLDHLSIHKYFRRGPSITFSDAEYTNLMLDLTEFESLIRSALAALDEVEPRRAKYPVFGKMPRNKPVSLVIDEWGVWHSDATIQDGFRENCTLRDAIFAASSLNLFQKYAQRVSMSNIAQVTNCLHSLILTDGAQMTLTPTFYVYEMFREHQGAQSLRTELANTAQISDAKQSRPAINASASRSGNSVLITVVNQSLSTDSELRIDLRGARAGSASATSLSGPDVRSQNTLSQPQTVVPKPGKVELDGGELVAQVPAGSIQAIRIQLA